MSHLGHWIRSLVVVVVLGLIAQGVRPALGANFGSAGTPGTGGTTNGVWLTPNATWTVAEVGLVARFEAGLDATLTVDYVPTDLFVVENWNVPSCTGSSGYDLCVFDNNYGDNGVYGWNVCAGFVNGTHPTQVCTMDWVRFNLFFPTNNNQKRTLACHEVGHSVGLRHPDDGTNTTSCMNYDWSNLSLTGHDKSHINATY